jgi:hypothetical protein
MIIFTQPGIKAYSPSRISSTVIHGTMESCIAEVPDDFKLTERQMRKAGIDFWWCVESSQLTAENYILSRFRGGIVEGIEDQLNVSKEINIAYGIYAIAYQLRQDEFDVWELSIFPAAAVPEKPAIKSAREYIQTVYGTANFARTILLQDAESLLDVMQDYGDSLTKPLINAPKG